MINNDFTDFENRILDLMLSNAPKYKEILFEQLNNANISREKTQYYSLTFLEVDKERTGLPEDGKSGIILEMIINNLHKIPTDVLLHSKNGYVCELEVYNADSSEIDYDMQIENYSIIAESDFL